MPKIQTNLCIEEELLHQAKPILSRLGMDFSEAVNIFTCMVVEKNGLPFPVPLPEKHNEQQDLRAILAGFSDDFMSDGREQPLL
uniref:Type II toxin-antitoxin system antitoxin, RelB/DinJ family n=1 Tax=uncultured Thiotrichaceae bacterium TaxID=298394 RepID=A0A6S6TKC2_9GAMM|nr:MAG: Type II toxin-antitoxin system antitoxin, RelB/DinJ family [uncultured Thiotrichaceae bacterium]